ncbi:hypothetical protein E1193_18520 [Micromonospora sp. KC606]|uniref:hypothetical protein n=1 Tax=Micromonospora sp. KC606 TaxID=2530379 RepID=UPI0010463966|nr:hypothetical protein [Micromonospora sp. KC606]TDC79805.1 hypothetical protein E1193_18520 [Micromonospora sp. KC606]
MTMDDEQSDDAVPGAWPPAGDPPTPVPFDRRDYGDAEQLAELVGADAAADEPVNVVDEPVPVPPYDRTQKRRNQRALP